jgi:nucleoside 2-deoxyribosyltransferase
MKVYVGAKYSERSVAKRLMNELRSQGHKITVDWTTHTNEDAKSLSSYATDDVKGVRQADVAIFIMERQHKYKGCWVEVGVALGHGKRVIIIGNAGSSCIFANHPKVTQLPGGMTQFLSRPLKWGLKQGWMEVVAMYDPCKCPDKVEPLPEATQ